MSQELTKTLTDKITSEFPDIKYSSAKLITHGWDNNIIMLDDTFVFRFPKNDEYVKKLQMEIKVIEYLKNRVSIPIPDYKYIPQDKSFGGYPLIAGKELSIELFQAQNKETKDCMAKELGEFFTIIHLTPKEITDTFNLPLASWNSLKIQKLHKEIKEVLEPVLSKDEVTWLDAQFQHYFSLKGEVQMSLIHSDVGGDNILFDTKNGKVSGILDFADAEYGDSALDFSRLLDYGEDFMRSVIYHYRGSKDEDLVQRAKFRRLVGMVENMLEITKGKKLSTTYEEQRSHLNKKMELFPLIV